MGALGKHKACPYFAPYFQRTGIIGRQRANIRSEIRISSEMPQVERDTIARRAGQRSPSEKTWALRPRQVGEALGRVNMSGGGMGDRRP